MVHWMWWTCVVVMGGCFVRWHDDARMRGWVRLSVCALVMWQIHSDNDVVLTSQCQIHVRFMSSDTRHATYTACTSRASTATPLLRNHHHTTNGTSHVHNSAALAVQPRPQFGFCHRDQLFIRRAKEILATVHSTITNTDPPRSPQR